MAYQSAIIGLMVSLWIAAIFTKHTAMNRTTCGAAHYGGQSAVTVSELRRRLAAEHCPDRIALHMDSWLSAWSHAAPDLPLTAAQAHDVMQLHRECRMESCHRKRAAYWALVADGRIRPDGRAERTAER